MESAAFLLSLGVFIAAPALIRRYGLIPIVVFSTMTLALCALFFQSPDYFTVNVQPCILGLVAGITFRYKKSYQFFILTASLSLATVFSAQFVFLKYAVNVDMAILIKERFLEVVQLYPVSEENKTLFISEIDQMLKLFSVMFPFVYFVNTLIWSSISWPIMKFLVKSFRKKGTEETPLQTAGIDNFRLNDYTVFILIASLALVAVFKEKPETLPFLAGLNSAFICMILYFIQAIGILVFFVKKKKLPPFSLPLIVLLFVAIGIPGALLPITIMISAWGLFDLWIDFRKLSVPDQGRDEKNE